MPTHSLATSLAHLPERERKQVLAKLSDDELLCLQHDWRFWARPSQLAPEREWSVWLVLAGRGFGKTRLGAEWINWRVETGQSRRIALVAETAADARDVMVEGESGLLACAPPWNKPLYEPSKRRLTWPNGAVATTYSADKPDQLRGPQHDTAWADELAKWRYADAWDQLQFGLRLGTDPRAVVTTTPRPIPIIRELVDDPTTAVTRGNTYENAANLAPAFLRKLQQKYEGTRLGRQEINAEILDDCPGALWSRDLIEEHRVRKVPELVRIVVAVDPNVSNTEDSDEIGIVAAGIARNGHAYILEDASLSGSPDEWARKAVALYTELEADRIVAEINNGGNLVEYTIRTVDENVSYTGVHASRGKRIRAEPVAALYEQGKVHHVGAFPGLEDQLCTWDSRTGEKSPDRLDALVWALTDLCLEEGVPAPIEAPPPGPSMSRWDSETRGFG